MVSHRKITESLRQACLKETNKQTQKEISERMIHMILGKGKKGQQLFAFFLDLFSEKEICQNEPEIIQT